MKAKDLTGQRFSRWVVVERQPNSNNGTAMWKVRCDCGNEKVVNGYTLRSGQSKSCGCLNSELASLRQKQNPTYKQTHGMSNTKFYRHWQGAVRRCRSDKSYKEQIFVCERWSCFENFKDDMYESYIKHCGIYGDVDVSLDRIDGYGNYEPQNCRWVTLKQQYSHQQRKKVRGKHMKDNLAGV